MANLAQLIRTLADRPAVQAVLLASGDGLPIDQAGRISPDGDAVAALAATLARHAGRLGEAAGRTGLGTAVLEYDDGLCILAALGAGGWLVVLTAAEADVGELLYELRRDRPVLSALL